MARRMGKSLHHPAANRRLIDFSLPGWDVFLKGALEDSHAGWTPQISSETEIQLPTLLFRKFVMDSFRDESVAFRTVVGTTIGDQSFRVVVSAKAGN